MHNVPEDNFGTVQRSLSSEPNFSVNMTSKLYIIKITTNLFTLCYWDHFYTRYTFDILYAIWITVHLHHNITYHHHDIGC